MDLKADPKAGGKLKNILIEIHLAELEVNGEGQQATGEQSVLVERRPRAAGQ